MADEQTTDTEAGKEPPTAILARLDALWRETQQAVAGMSESELAAPGRAGEWSAKDLLAHIARWNDTAVTVIEGHLAGRRPAEQYDDFDAWNARWAEEDRALAPAEARRRCDASYERLRILLAELPPERWDRLVRGWVHGSGVEHLEEHLPQFRARPGRS